LFVGTSVWLTWLTHARFGSFGAASVASWAGSTGAQAGLRPAALLVSFQGAVISVQRPADHW
jgi:hypothetical protein